MSVEKEKRRLGRREFLKEALAGLSGFSFGFLTGRLTTPPTKQELEVKPKPSVEVDFQLGDFDGKTSISAELLEANPLLKEKVKLIARGDLKFLGELLALEDPKLINEILTIIAIKRKEAIEEILRECPPLENEFEAKDSQII